MGSHYHGPEVAPEEFPDQEDEAGGGEVGRYDHTFYIKNCHLFLKNQQHRLDLTGISDSSCLSSGYITQSTRALSYDGTSGSQKYKKAI